MPTGKAECFGQQSREEGIKQKVNTCITPARTKAQSCIDWLIEQHRIGRPHIIELSKQIASGFEKSISQRTSLQRPLQQPEIFARDNEFLLNIQWLLENWAELISTINQGFLAIDGRALTDTIQLFEVEFQRMATAIQIYITKSKEPQIIKMQQATIKLKSTLSLNPVYPTPDLIELGKKLDESITLVSLEQFQKNIVPLRTIIADIQQSLSNPPSAESQPKPPNVERFYVALAESLKQCQEILLSIKDDLTDQMLLVMNKLQQVTKQVKSSEKPQEQFELKQNILALAKERFTKLTRDFSVDPAMRLVDITIAQAMLPKEEELSQQKPMTTESLIIIELIHLLDTENKKIEKLVAKDDRKTRHFRKMSQVMQQKAAGQPTDKADEELLRLLQDEKIRLENALKKGKEEFAQTMEKINKIKNPHKRLMTLNQKLQELSKSQKADVTAAAPSVTPPVRLLPAAASATQPQPLQEALQLKKSDGLDELDMLLEFLTAGDPPASARASIPHVLPTQQKTPRIPRTTEQFESLEPSPHPLMFTTAPQLPPEPNPASHHSRSSSSFTSDSQFAKFVATTTAAIKNPSFTL